MTPTQRSRVGIPALTNTTGMYGMLAVDQRESLRAMMTAVEGGEVADAELSAFKIDATKAISPMSTAVLLDRFYSREAADVAECPIVLAADVLSQERGGPVTGSSVDTGITAELARRFHASALKMLVQWEPRKREAAIELAASFMELCRSCGLPGIVEGIVHPHDIAEWSQDRRNDALITAATDFASVSPDLYKAEVPSFGRGDEQAIITCAASITEAVPCDWVVLSSGVAPADFARAVTLCVAGGASGFLAGRAVWMDALTSDNVHDYLWNESRPRFRSLLRAIGDA